MTMDLRWILILKRIQLGKSSKQLVLTVDPDTVMVVVVVVPDPTLFDLNFGSGVREMVGSEKILSKT
jgi:hypothetical protein